MCAEGQVCVDETCQADECDPSECQQGQTCLGGECSDNPCDGVVCPANQRCEVIDGTAQCIADWTGDPSDEPDMGMGSDAGMGQADSGNSTEPGSDGGVAEQDGGDAPEADAGGMTGAGGNPADGPGDGDAAGCACDVGGEQSPSPFAIFVAAILGLGLARRRRG